MSVYTTKELLEILPHRQPMLLIDTLEELEPGKRAVGKKCVSYNEPYFAGHFPGAAVMLSCPEFKGKLVYFGGIEHCRFRKKVVPGDVLMLEVEMIRQKGPLGVGKATATVDGKTAVTAELTFAIG